MKFLDESLLQSYEILVLDPIGLRRLRFVISLNGSRKAERLEARASPLEELESLERLEREVVPPRFVKQVLLQRALGSKRPVPEQHDEDEAMAIERRHHAMRTHLQREGVRSVRVFNGKAVTHLPSSRCATTIPTAFRS